MLREKTQLSTLRENQGYIRPEAGIKVEKRWRKGWRAFRWEGLGVGE